MSKNGHRIYKLNREIVMLQLEENDKVKLRNAERERKNKLHFYHLSLVLAFIILLISFSFISLAIGLVLVIIGSSIDVYLEEKLRSEREEVPYKEIRGENDFSYEEYRYSKALKKVMSEEKRKYQEAAKKQNEGKEKEEKAIYYSKEDEINIMVEMIEDYFKAYMLPPLRVKPYEWDAFFDVLFNEFRLRGIRENYFYVVSEVIRYTLANALVNETSLISASDFIDSLKYLYRTRTNEGILPEIFTYEDVVKLQEKIRMRIRRKRRKERSIKQLKNEL